MRLKLLNIFGQRNPEWANEILGFNIDPKYSIGFYGCLITSFGMYVDKKPNEINQILKANNGFTTGSGNFVWSKASVLGLNQTYVSPVYSDAVTSQGLNKIREFLDKGNPLICEIDFHPETVKVDQHFVLIVGYEGDQFLVADPWTGTIVSLDIYGGPARAIIQFRAYDKTIPQDLSNSDQVVKQAEAFVAICIKLNLPIDRDVVLADIDKLLQYENIIRQKEQQISESQVKIDCLQESIKNLDEQLQVAKDENYKLSDKVTDQGLTIDTYGKEIKRLSSELQELSEANNTPVFTGLRKFIYNLVVSLLKK